MQLTHKTLMLILFIHRETESYGTWDFAEWQALSEDAKGLYKEMATEIIRELRTIPEDPIIVEEPSVDVETLAMELHEAGREAVARGMTLHIPPAQKGRRVHWTGYKWEEVPGPGQRFVEWADLPEHVREGRRIQARFLLSRWHITWKEQP